MDHKLDWTQNRLHMVQQVDYWRCEVQEFYKHWKFYHKMGIHTSMIDRLTLPKCIYFLFFWINIVIDCLRCSRPLLFVSYSWIRLALTEKKFKLEYVIANTYIILSVIGSNKWEKHTACVYDLCDIGLVLVFTNIFMGQCPILEFCW